MNDINETMTKEKSTNLGHHLKSIIVVICGFMLGSSFVDVIFHRYQCGNTAGTTEHGAVGFNSNNNDGGDIIVEFYVNEKSENYDEVSLSFLSDRNNKNEKKKKKKKKKESDIINEDNSVVLKSSRPLFTEMPPSITRKTFYSEGWKNSHRVQRALRASGWRKVNEPMNATLVYCDFNDAWFTRNASSWQRFNHIPNSTAFTLPKNYLDGWKRYHSNININKGKKKKQKNKEGERSITTGKKAYFLPEAYSLTNAEDRNMIKQRFMTPSSKQKKHRHHHNHRPLVFYKDGIQPFLLESNKESIEELFISNPISTSTSKKGTDQSWISEYICNQLTWHDGQTMIVRVIWFVATMDPIIVFYQDGYVRIGINEYEHTENYYTDKSEAPFEELELYLKRYVSSHSNLSSKKHQRLSKKIRNDPMTHVRNQFKESIAILVDAFEDDAFNTNTLRKAEDAFEVFAADFIIDQNLDVWLWSISSDSPGESYYTFLLEDYYFLLKKNHDIYYYMVQILDELWEKQAKNDNRKNSILPLSNTGPWEIIVAGSSWRFNYPDYQRESTTDKKKKAMMRYCKLPRQPKFRQYNYVTFDDDWIPEWTADDEGN